jgi:hypothetical protein
MVAREVEGGDVEREDEREPGVDLPQELGTLHGSQGTSRALPSQWKIERDGEGGRG